MKAKFIVCTIPDVKCLRSFKTTVVSVNTSLENNGIQNNMLKIHSLIIWKYITNIVLQGPNEDRQKYADRHCGKRQQILSTSCSIQGVLNWLLFFTQMTTKDDQEVVCTLWNLSALMTRQVRIWSTHFNILFYKKKKKEILYIVFWSKLTCAEYCYQSGQLGVLSLTGSQGISNSYTACDTETERNLER